MKLRSKTNTDQLRAALRLPPTLRFLQVVLFSIVLGMWVTACGTVSQPSAAPAIAMKESSESSSETRLRGGDQVQVRLDTGAGQAQQPIEVIIDENGEISLPLVGRIKAAGSTTGELGARIRTAYEPRFYIHCNATVLATTRFFYVGGEVRQPGRFPWSEDITLLKAINTAGGFTEYSNRRKVELARDKDKYVFDYEAIRQNPAKDVPIRPGDSIYVSRSVF
jgi:polysaccharide export outer membrane protein